MQTLIDWLEHPRRWPTDMSVVDRALTFLRRSASRPLIDWLEHPSYAVGPGE